jgi:O-succinylbenzoic acid--CoA ligase
VTFAELDQRVDAIAAAMPYSPGSHVGIRMPNSIDFVLAVHALMRIGAVIVPINTRLTAAEVDYIRTDAALNTILESLPPPAAAPPQAVRYFDLDAVHSIIYTSGTTGRPKGALLTYHNHWWSAVASMLNLGVQATDRWLACLPLFHVGGLSILLRSVIYGMPVLLHDRFDPDRVNAAIDNEGVTIVSVVSTMLDRMLSARGERAYPSTLRCVLLGGGPAPVPLLERALALGAPVFQTYGLTETASQVATLAPEDVLRKVGSAGKPLFGTELRIAEDGEILVRGPVVSPGYLGQPPRGDWLATGDLGYVDDEGYLYIHDRREDLIVTGGENVYPAEVEAVLLAHPLVLDAGVFGTSDREWGQAVCAAIVVADRVDMAALQTFCRERLAAYKVPRRLHVVDTLPRTANGKLLRRHLRALQD